MRNQIVLLLILVVITACSCNQIKYEADNAFLNSAQANSMEYYVRVNGSPCRDVDGLIGLCAKRIKSDQGVKFSLDGKEYGYRLEFECSAEINYEHIIDIPAGKPHSFIIPPSKFKRYKRFTCQGEVFPHDRKQQVSASFSVRIVVGWITSILRNNPPLLRFLKTA